MKPDHLILLFIVPLLVVGTNACEKLDKDNLYDQSIYFEYYSINQAWGQQYSHWIIDNQGNVLGHHKTDSLIWIDENNINETASAFDSVIYKIELSELRSYVDLIPIASKGQISCSEAHRADFGGIVYNAFYNDKTILLSSMSDIEDCYNLDPRAVYIADWLKSIQNNTSSDKYFPAER